MAAYSASEKFFSSSSRFRMAAFSRAKLIRSSSTLVMLIAATEMVFRSRMMIRQRMKLEKICPVDCFTESVTSAALRAMPTMQKPKAITMAMRAMAQKALVTASWPKKMLMRKSPLSLYITLEVPAKMSKKDSIKSTSLSRPCISLHSSTNTQSNSSLASHFPIVGPSFYSVSLSPPGRVFVPSGCKKSVRSARPLPGRWRSRR